MHGSLAAAADATEVVGTPLTRGARTRSMSLSAAMSRATMFAKLAGANAGPRRSGSAARGARSWRVCECARNRTAQPTLHIDTGGGEHLQKALLVRRRVRAGRHERSVGVGVRRRNVIRVGQKGFVEQRAQRLCTERAAHHRQCECRARVRT